MAIKTEEEEVGGHADLIGIKDLITFSRFVGVNHLVSFNLRYYGENLV